MIITKIHKTHVACPATWDAETDDGQQIRFFYRWGKLYTEGPPIGPPDLSINHGDEDWGSLSFGELLQLVQRHAPHITFDCEES